MFTVRILTAPCCLCCSCSVAQQCPPICDPMDCSILGFPVLHCLPVHFCSVAQSCLTPCNHMHCSTPGSLSITNSQSLLKLMSIESVMPSNHLILCCHLLLLPSIFPIIRSFPMSQFFPSSGQSIGVSASASVFPMNIQDYFLQDGLVGSPCNPRDSQESSLTPQFKNINSLALSFLYSTTLTSIHD